MNTKDKIIELKLQGKTHGDVVKALGIAYHTVYMAWRDYREKKPLLDRIKNLELQVKK